MIARAAVYFRRIRRWFTRSYWALRIFPLPKYDGPSSSPGLIIVQVDGLAQKQMRRALKEGRLPFMRRLIEKEKYKQYSHYSGVPSSTPAVQAELFYGVKTAVPAFNFCDHESGEAFTMYEPKCAAAVEERLAKGNLPLLEGGSSYSNIYTGGAAENHFCVAGIGWQGIFKALNPLTWTFLFIFHLDIILRTACLLLVEMVLGVYDCIRGALKGEKIFYEFQFIFTRVFICVLMRELVVLGAKVDIARGLPVIHVNFFGYDEQAHRRGPSSSFAHWCLRGIDDSIRRLWREAQLAERRDYDLWIYSDHGQEDTLPYPVKAGKRLEDIVAEIFGDPAAVPIQGKHRSLNYGCCARSPKHRSESIPESHTKKPEAETPKVKILGMGPLCHIYPALELSPEDKMKAAREILARAGVPAVLIPEETGEVKVLTSSGVRRLPEDAAEILGHDHPFLEEASQDLVRLCFHPDAGKLIVSGWRAGRKPETFPIENGSHAGFGQEETHGFALLPPDAPLPEREHEYLRPLDIREAVLHALGKRPEALFVRRPASAPKFLRVASYNVHGCMGMDGKISPERIARVLARYHPDAIALQELDAGRGRSGMVHQADVIARKLQMDFHFHPSFFMDGHYGNAILSRHPMRLVKCGALPQLSKQSEPRGALWVEIDLEGTPVQFINTHLSLWPKERHLQIKELLGPDWAGSPRCRQPLILAGDFNAPPKTRGYSLLIAKLYDTQLLLDSHEPYGTWMGSHPLSRIDHVFVSADVQVRKIEVPGTALDKAASDHCPLFVDLEVISQTAEKASPPRAEERGAVKING